MPRLFRAALVLVLLAPAAALAADLDGQYAPPLDAPPRARVHARRHIVKEEIVHRRVIEEVVERRVVAEVVPPVPVGGPYLVVPGLNGPYGPPIYPLLPFSFGYGY